MRRVQGAGASRLHVHLPHGFDEAGYGDRQGLNQENVYQRIFTSPISSESKRNLDRIASAVGFFRGSYAIGPCVDNNWLALG